MKVTKLYRLRYKDDYWISFEFDFYTSKEEALAQLDSMKQKIRYLYDDGCIPLTGHIVLETFNLENISDINHDSREDLISEWEEKDGTTNTCKKVLYRHGKWKDNFKNGTY